MIGVVVPIADSDNLKEDKVNKINSFEAIEPENYPTAYLVNESIKDVRDQIDDLWINNDFSLQYTGNVILTAQSAWQGHQRDGGHFGNPTFIFQGFNPSNPFSTNYDWRAFKGVIPFDCKITGASVSFQSGTPISVDFAVLTANLPQGSTIGVPEQGTNKKVNIRETLSLTASNTYCNKTINPANITSDIIHQGAFWTVLFNNGNIATNLYSFTLLINFERVKL